MTEQTNRPAIQEQADRYRAASRIMWAVRVCAFLLAAAGLFLAGRYLLNERFLAEYRSGRYTDTWERPLLPLNLPEGWLPRHFCPVRRLQAPHSAMRHMADSSTDAAKRPGNTHFCGVFRI